MKPINPFNKVMSIDLEGTQLPGDFYLFSKPDGSLDLPPLGEITRGFEHVHIFQAGYISGDDMVHLDVSEAKFSSPKMLGENLTVPEVFKDANGVTRTYVRNSTSSMSEEGVNKLFKSSLSKLSPAKQEAYKKKVLPYYLMKSKKNTQFILDDGSAIGSMPFEVFSKSYEDMQKIASDAGFDYAKVTQEKFLGRGEGSLFKAISDLLDGATKQKPSIMRAWNPSYDAPAIIASLERSGNKDLAEKMLNSYKNGLLKIEGIEKEWHEILWKLLKENKEITGDIKIGMHPLAAAATGRPGGIVRTFEEFKYSTFSWNQRDLAKLFHGHKNLKEIGHIASTDIKQSEAFASIMKDIKAEAINIHGGNISFEELFASDDTNGIFTKALNRVIKKDFTGKARQKTGRELVEAAIGQAKKTELFHKQQFASWFAADISKAKGASWRKYPGFFGVAAGLALTTYMAAGETPLSLSKDGTRYSSGVPMGGSISESAQGGGDNIFLENGLVRPLVTGLVIPGLTVGAIGYGASQRFNIMSSDVPMPSNFREAKDQFFKTMRYGMKVIEGQLPIARVFGIGSLTDYIRGSRSYMVDEAGNGLRLSRSGKPMPGRFHTFSVVDNGRIIRESNPRHGTNLDNLLFNVKKKNPSQYEQLQNILAPDLSKINENIRPDRRNIRIASTNTGKTIIFYDDFKLDKAGNAQKITGLSKEKVLIDEAISLAHVRDVIPQAASRSRRASSDSSRIVSSNVIEKLHEDLAKFNPEIGQKINFEEYLSSLEVPGFVRNNEAMTGVWRSAEKIRWALDLTSKGVGERANKLFPEISNRVASTQTVALVKDARHYMRLPGAFTLGAMDKFLETPFEFLGIDSSKITGAANKLKASPNIISNVLGKTLSAIESPHLGLGYSRYGSAAKYLGAFGVKRVLPAFLAVQAFGLADHVLGKVTASPTGRGPLTTLPIKMYEGASLLYSKISDIVGLTSYSKWQENVAPGSTGLGIMAPALTATTSMYLGQMAYKYGPDFIKDGANRIGRKMLKHPLIKAAARPEAYKGALMRGPAESFLSYVIKNPKKAIFGLSLLPALPFLPGFLGSNKTYEERKAEFKGDKEVAVRKYRGWLLSSSPFAGGSVRSWRKHALNVFESDYENRGVLYPSYWDKFLHKISLGTYKPYMLEEYHKESQPVYKSAPWGINVPLIGPILAATVGKVIPQKVYHTPGEENEVETTDHRFGLSAGLDNGSIKKFFDKRESMEGFMVSLHDPTSLTSLSSRFADSLADLAGFRGFALQTAYQKVSGQALPDEFVPYAQDASQMYNASELMWQYNLGDISVVGGEFMRRILQSSEKKWQENRIRNELYGVSWIPQGENGGKDLTHGTTFNKVDMGWLYGARKGWEFLYGNEARGPLESYGAPVRTEILKHIAPYSNQFNQEARSTLEMALTDQLDPKREQRFYETLFQVAQVKEQLYAKASEFTYTLETDDDEGTVDFLDEESGAFSINGKNYRLAGVSLNEADIRARLLQKREYKDAQQLHNDVDDIRERSMNIMRRHLSAGSFVNFQKAKAEMLPETRGMGQEVMMEDLAQELWDAGAPFANTGHLATHNVAQDKAGISSKIMASYWDALTERDSFWNKKLINKRDYLDSYLSSQVFNREVKLWTRPIEHILMPFISTTMHSLFGVDIIPSFTKERRANQQYWDVIRYIKYKRLSVEASMEGDASAAAYYEGKWRSTMVGANPTDSSTRDELNALPYGERRFFDMFSSESDPEKRQKLFKYLPEGAKRIYSSIWMSKLAQASDDPEVIAQFNKLRESEGWNLSEEEEQAYLSETDGTINKADWARAKFVQEYASKNNLPGPDWIGWNEGVDLDNAHVLSLLKGDENVQDYGYFDSKIREAVYDESAHKAVLQIDSNRATSSRLINASMGYLLSDRSIVSATTLPTSSQVPMAQVEIQSNSYNKILSKLHNFESSILDDSYIDPIDI